MLMRKEESDSQDPHLRWWWTALDCDVDEKRGNRLHAAGLLRIRKRSLWSEEGWQSFWKKRMV